MATYTVPMFIDSLGRVKKGITSGDIYSVNNRVTLKRGDTVSLAIKFLDDSTTPVAFKLADGATVQVAMKEKGKYGSSNDYAAFGTTNTTPTTVDGVVSPYIVNLSVVGSVIDALIGVGSQTEQEYVDVMFEVSWSEDGGATFNSTSEPIEARVYNDVIRAGTDTPPLAVSLNIPQVYNGSLSHGASSVSTTPVTSSAVKLDLAEIFGVKHPEVGFFEIKAQAAFRKVYNATASSAVDGGFVYTGIVKVDLSSDKNYLTNSIVPFVSEVLSDDLSNPVNYGTLEVLLVGGGLTTPNATYKQASAISLSFKHTAAATTPEAFADIVWTYQITRVGLISSLND